MKTIIEEESLDEIIKTADLRPKRKAFRNHLPYAILKDGNVVLVYPDKHVEPATAERLLGLQPK
ncbi:MAG TPA: hypothetical protein VFE53_03185 [Mucilaginibacter sp.]|jgi:hypothetical protein|nr:hypothetical protein [Mucilaginibacter sp.]